MRRPCAFSSRRTPDETAVSVLFDGGNQSGMLGMYYATRAVIVVGGATANPVHAKSVESALTGIEPTEANIAAAADTMDIEATLAEPRR